MIVPVRVRGRDLKPHKATVAPQLDARTVLTRSPWEFVSLWLSRKGQREALFYWDQARRFARGAENMPVEAAPLLHYYSFMNATKALLVSKGVRFREHHGIRAHNMRGASNKIALSNEGVSIQAAGILPSLATVLGDTEMSTNHSLKDLLFNLPFVHRTYCLTYRSQSDLFFPLTDCQYVFDTNRKEAFLSAKLSKDFARNRYGKKLPSTLAIDSASADPQAIRSTSMAAISNSTPTSAADLGNLRQLHQTVRSDVLYISASQTLWYAKGNVAGPARLRRSPLTLTLAAMHRLSELSRYRPLELKSFLSGQRNWLITEFVLMAPEQFLDGIASELTGYQFLLPNVRPAQ